MNPQDDIRTASTPTGERYSSKKRLEHQKEGLFLQSFHLLRELSEGSVTRLSECCRATSMSRSCLPGTART